MENLLPAFSENNIAIAICADDNFAPCTAVLIRSVLAKGERRNNYDFVLFHSGMREENQRKLAKVTAGYKNASLRFLDITRFIAGYTFFVGGKDNFSRASYYRLLVPDLMSEYGKVLYLDGDMVAVSDVAEICHAELGNHLIAACRDIAGLMAYYNPDYQPGHSGLHRKEYWDRELGLADADSYVNAGLILFNIPEFRKAYTSEEILGLAASREWECHDQDVLNVLCQGRILLLDPTWNSIYGSESRFLPDVIRAEYQECWAHPKIAHYAGPFKPWAVPDAPFQELFWPYAAETPYLETLLRELILRNGGREEWNARAGIEAQFRQGQAGMAYLLRLGRLWLDFKRKGRKK